MPREPRPSPKTLRIIYNRLLSANDGGDITEISGQSKDHPFTMACAVVEAQGVWDFLWFVRTWLQLIDQGKVDERRLDPTRKLPDNDKTIEFIDAAVGEFYGPTVDEKVLLPKLKEMPLAARQAFYQEGCAVIQTSEEVRRKAQALLDEGIELPPWPNV